MVILLLAGLYTAVCPALPPGPVVSGGFSCVQAGEPRPLALPSIQVSLSGPAPFSLLPPKIVIMLFAASTTAECRSLAGGAVPEGESWIQAGAPPVPLAFVSTQTLLSAGAALSLPP